MRIIFYITLLIQCTWANAQVYLNDTTLFGGTSCIYSSVYEADSGFFYMGQMTRLENGNKEELILGFTHNNGTNNLILDQFEPTNNQRVGGGQNKLIYNHNENFVYLFNNCGNGNCYPRLKEITPEGVMLNDISFQSVVDSFHLIGFDFNNFIQKEYDSSYVVLSNMTDTTLPSNVHKSGVLYLHLNKNGSLLDSIYIFNPTNTSDYTIDDVTELSEGKILLLLKESIQSGTNANEIDTKLFVTIDKNGTILSTVPYSDGQKITFGMGLTKCDDGGFLFTYPKCTLNGTAWEYMNYVCKVDASFDVVWKKEIDNLVFGGQQFLMTQEIKPTMDGNFVMGGGTAMPDDPSEHGVAHMTKFTESGDFLWQRYLYKIEDVSVTTSPFVTIKDIIATADSGYCMVGQVTDYPELNAGNSGVYGYLVKTNCLGFLGNSEAAASHLVKNNFEVEFYNTSLQAGSYQWDFGDGTSLWTDEYVDTVWHTYAGQGNYSVQLIAYGCNGDSDTLTFDVAAAGLEDLNPITDALGYFTVFPNPAQSGGEVNIYLNALQSQNGDVSIRIYSLEGRSVDNFQLGASKGNYSLPHALETGVYYFTLYQGDKQLQSRKLVVE